MQGTPELGDQRGLGAERPVADGLVGLGVRQVKHGGAVRADAAGREFVAQQAGIQRHRLAPGLGVAGGQLAELGGRRHGAPVRRPQALNPAAFLIHQDRRVGPPHAVQQIAGQGRDLFRRLAVSLEEDETVGIGLGEE